MTAGFEQVREIQGRVRGAQHKRVATPVRHTLLARKDIDIGKDSIECFGVAAQEMTPITRVTRILGTSVEVLDDVTKGGVVTDPLTDSRCPCPSDCS